MSSSTKRFAAVLEYDGTAYHGWQLQKDVPTVQGAVEQALGRILGRPTRVHGAGRTDAGVHAVGQVAHFETDWTSEPAQLQRACNALLPPDIAVRRLSRVSPDFHARHSATAKTYIYTIFNSSLRSPMLRWFAWHVPYALDISLMNQAASSLEGTHDFAAFGSPTDGTPSTARTMLYARWAADDSEGLLSFSIRGTGFLRYMVRSLVGTLVQVGNGKLTPRQFADILQSRDRSQAGPTARPHGLCLHRVDYPDPSVTGPVQDESVCPETP